MRHFSISPIRALRSAACGAALAAACACAVAAPSQDTKPSETLAATLSALTPTSRCGVAAIQAAHDASPSAKADPASNAADATKVAGLTHCWWACYPGSGCEYICRFFPQ